MTMKQQMNEILDLFTEIMDEKGSDIAEAYYGFYEDLKEAGFTEEEAMKLLTENPMELSANE